MKLDARTGPVAADYEEHTVASCSLSTLDRCLQQGNTRNAEPPPWQHIAETAIRLWHAQDDGYGVACMHGGLRRSRADLYKSQAISTAPCTSPSLFCQSLDITARRLL